MRTTNDLVHLQALPLSLKVALTKDRIRQWVNEFGIDGIYVSFSGGKDSTVLLHIVRELYPGVPAVFCDTGLEFPEIREYVKTYDNVKWLKPKVTFRQVIEKYGYPFISKEVSQKVWEVRTYGKEHAKSSYTRFLPNNEYSKRYGVRYSYERYSFLLEEDAPMLSHKCCSVMKKDISKQYEKETGRKAIIGTMACESDLRRQSWIAHGCNSFDEKRQTSKPLSFWTENDVLQYIKQNEIPLCSLYGDIVEPDEIKGQISWDEYIGFDIGAIKLDTTGLKRTGCMFCGYGCHIKKNGEGKFETMKRTHPKQYEWIMKDWDKGGLGYKKVIDWINEHGNLNIRY